MMRWPRLFRRVSRDAESARDIQFYLDTETDENIARGMSPEDARAAARRKFGNPTFVQEEIHRMTNRGLLDTAWQDLRYAFRTLRNNPVFALTAVLILTLGIGANTAIFTVIRTVLLKPLDYRDPDRLVRIAIDNPRQSYQDIGVTLVRFEEMQKAARSFAALGCFFIATEDVTLSGKNGPDALKGARVSANFLDVLGVLPALGRGFLAEEDQPNGRPVAMISMALWKTHFGANPTVIGKTVLLNAVPHTIIGVLPARFQFPQEGVDVWVPRPSEFSGIPPQAWRRTNYLIAFGRLKAGVTLAQAHAEADVLNRQYIATHPDMPDGKPDVTMRTVLVKDHLISNARTTLLVLFGAVGFVLLIACANVASLMLARAASRSREFALRAALGAARTRLISQLLAESLLLAVAGGGLGIWLAKGILRIFTNTTTLPLPRSGEIQLDATVLLFTVALSLVTGILFGLVPSFHASRPDLAVVLRERGEGAGPISGQRSRWRGALGVSSRGFLVIGQVALSIVLLIGAALLMESLIQLYSVNPGFQPAHLLTMQIALPRVRYDTGQKRLAFYQELVRRVETIHGVRGASVALTLPMGPKWAVGIQVVEQAAVNVNDRPGVQLQSITPGFFRTLGISLQRGREYTAADDFLTAPPRVIINESLARRFWPGYPRGISPIGQHLRLGNDQTSNGLEIIGIATDVHEKGLAANAGPELYLPCHLNPPQAVGLIVHTDGDPFHLVNAIRSQVLSIDRDQPITAVKTMDELIETSVRQYQLTFVLLGSFAGVALLLAMVGIYGVIAYSVEQRTQELGIRRALGAQQGDILGLVIGQSLGLTLVGIVLGLGGAFALTRVMTDLLFHVHAADPLTFLAVSGLFLLLTLAASYFPAHRAARVDPMEALRVG